MAGQLEHSSSRSLTAGLLAVAFGLLLLFVPVAAAQAGEAYPPSSSSTSSSTSSTSTTSTTDPAVVERSTLERSSTGSDTLPRTGSEIAPWIATGFILVAVGGGILYLTRRNRTTA